MRGKREKNITPAESGVGESIVSADSPGGESNARHQQGQQQHQQQQRTSTPMGSDGVGRKCCVTPTRDVLSERASDERVRAHLMHSSLLFCFVLTFAFSFLSAQRLRLDAESVTQFTTLPAQDRITRYLESLSELGGVTQRGGGGGGGKGGVHPPLPLLPHFPPPPPVPPPPPQQTAAGQQRYQQALRNARVPPAE